LGLEGKTDSEEYSKITILLITGNHNRKPEWNGSHTFREGGGGET